MSMTAAQARMTRLARTVQAAASQLNAIDSATVERIGLNLQAFQADITEVRCGPQGGAEYAGLFSVNLDELLDIIERLSRP